MCNSVAGPLLPGSDNISGFFIPSPCRVSLTLGLYGLVQIYSVTSYPLPPPRAYIAALWNIIIYKLR